MFQNGMMALTTDVPEFRSCGCLSNYTTVVARNNLELRGGDSQERCRTARLRWQRMLRNHVRMMCRNVTRATLARPPCITPTILQHQQKQQMPRCHHKLTNRYGIMCYPWRARSTDVAGGACIANLAHNKTPRD
jgi:hypothetical protein